MLVLERHGHQTLLVVAREPEAALREVLADGVEIHGHDPFSPSSVLGTVGELSADDDLGLVELRHKLADRFSGHCLVFHEVSGDLLEQGSMLLEKRVHLLRLGFEHVDGCCLGQTFGIGR